MKKIVLICVSLIACLNLGRAGNNQGNVLPIALQSFSAISSGGKVNLTWKAFTGKSNIYFTVEKSLDGKNFSKIVDAIGMGGEAVGYKDYVEVDYKPYKGKSYYRLKQTDEKGECKYSAPVVVTVMPQKKIAVYHMPPNALADISKTADGHDSQEVVLVLRDVQGSEFVSKVLLMVEKNVVFLLDEKKELPKGNYTITSSSYDKIYNYQLTVR